MVSVGSGRGESVAEGLPRADVRGVQNAARVGSDGVRDGVVVGPGHRRARFDGHRLRREGEVLDRDGERRGGRRGRGRRSRGRRIARRRRDVRRRLHDRRSHVHVRHAGGERRNARRDGGLFETEIIDAEPDDDNDDERYDGFLHMLVSILLSLLGVQ